MKKMTISITALLLLLASLLTLQAGAQWSAGAKAGINISNFDAKSINNLRSKTGAVLGGFAQYRFQPQFSAQGEILYSMQGARQYDGSYDFNYLQIPLLAQYRVWKGLQLQTGPQIGFLLSAKINEDGDKEDIRDAVTSGDISWILGTSYEFSNGLIADFRYIKGLSDISDNNAKIRNRMLQLTIGYRLKGNRK